MEPETFWLELRVYNANNHFYKYEEVVVYYEEQRRMLKEEGKVQKKNLDSVVRESIVYEA